MLTAIVITSYLAGILPVQVFLSHTIDVWKGEHAEGEEIAMHATLTRVDRWEYVIAAGWPITVFGIYWLVFLCFRKMVHNEREKGR